MKKYILAMFAVCSMIAVHADSMSGACSVLSDVEQSFAQGMTEANRQMFCQGFNQSQRNSAMSYQASGMSADQSVEKVAKDNNMMPLQSKGMGCPVK